MLSDQKLADLLKNVRTIAVIGAKDLPGQAVDGVGRYLIDAGYTVLPVHPSKPEVWGRPAFKSLADIDVPIDIVDVFRRADFCPAHAREALAVSPLPKLFWLQLGIVSDEAVKLAADAGMVVEQDRCLKVEHRRLAALGLLNGDHA